MRRIYLKHKIRFKNIKRGKKEIDFTEPHYRSLFHRMQSLLQQMCESNTQVVYLDEIMFTFSTFRSKGWGRTTETEFASTIQI